MTSNSESELNSLWLVRVFGAEWAYVIFYALFGVTSITLSVYFIGWHSYWIPTVGGLLLGALYGLDRARKNPETLAHYIGVRALFPRLVRSRLAHANGGECWGARGRADIVPIRLIVMRRWNGRSGIKLLVFDGGALKTTFVPEDVLIAYMRCHFTVEIHTVSGAPGEHSYQHFYFPLELKPQVDVKAK